jgi:hypothetical protein
MPLRIQYLPGPMRADRRGSVDQASFGPAGLKKCMLHSEVFNFITDTSTVIQFLEVHGSALYRSSVLPALS